VVVSVDKNQMVVSGHKPSPGTVKKIFFLILKKKKKRDPKKWKFLSPGVKIKSNISKKKKI
jgi:hypothetical protein